MEVLGIDIGGSGIKGAPVDIAKGELTGDRFRIETPKPAKPEAVIECVSQVVAHFDWKGPVGCGFPGVCKLGKTYTAANLTPEWIGLDSAELMKKVTGCDVALVNDADAAGLAEATFGAGRDFEGLVVMVTLGTGLGVALINKGVVVPNMELGHLKMKDGIVAEKYAAESAKKREDLSWKDYGSRLNEYLLELEFLLNPDLIMLGGGASKKFEKYENKLKLSVDVIPASLLNLAGIIGAAYYAHQQFPHVASQV